MTSPNNGQSSSSAHNLAESSSSSSSSSPLTEEAALLGIKEQWNYYYRYSTVARYFDKIPVKNAKGFVTVKGLGATCFWLALSTIAPYDKVEPLIKGRDLTKPVTLEQAIGILSGSGIPVHWHNYITGDVDSCGHECVAGPLQVLVADGGVWAPHWLPVWRLKPKEKHLLADWEVDMIKEKVKPKVEVKVEKVLPDLKTLSNQFEILVDEVPVDAPQDLVWGTDDKVDIVMMCQFLAMAQGKPWKRVEPEPEEDFELEGMAPMFEEGRSYRMACNNSKQAKRVVAEEPMPPAWLFRESKSYKDACNRPQKQRIKEGDWNMVDIFGIPLQAPRSDGVLRPEIQRAVGETPPPTWGSKGSMWSGRKGDESCLWSLETEKELEVGLRERFRLWTVGKEDCKVVELRKNVLLGTMVRSGDLVYERVYPASNVNPLKTVRGGLHIDEVEEIDCGQCKYTINNVVELKHEGRNYKLGSLCLSVGMETIPFFRKLFGPVIPSFMVPRRRYKVNRIGIKVQGVDPITPAMLSAYPTDEAKVRAMYDLMRPLVPDPVVGPLNNVRNMQLAEKDLAEQAEKVPQIVQQTVDVYNAVMRQIAHIEAFGYVDKRRLQSCVSCGVDPVGKYRWKHRICNKCRSDLARQGFTTYAGYQVQQNAKTCTVYPGLVGVYAEEYPPKASKWRLVEVDKKDGQSVEISWSSALSKRGFEGPVKKWVDMEKDDLKYLKNLSKPTISHYLGGIGLAGARPMVSAGSRYNEAKALLGRVFLKLPEREWGVGPKPGIWQFAEGFKPWILPELDTEEMTFDAWLETMPSRRKKALLKGWTEYTRFGWKKQFKQFKSFVKRELLPGFSKKWYGLDKLDEMLDRLINGPHEATHGIAGPKLKPKTKKLKKYWNVDSPIFYGATDPGRLNAFLQRLAVPGKSYFWCDFSMFDRTHSEDSWRFVESFYHDISDPDFWKVMEAWRRPCGSIGPFRFVAPVMNASGRDDTALANALLNGFATFLSATAALYGKDLEELRVEDVRRAASDIVLSVCGDDSIGALPWMPEERMARFRTDFQKNIEKFGFQAKLVTSERLVDAVYLGHRPYLVGGRWVWGKTIGRASYKMGWVQNKDQDVMAHVTGIADMHMKCSRHVPVLSDLAAKIVELRTGAKRTPVEIEVNKPWEWTDSPGDYDDDTLRCVAETYSVKSTPGFPIERERTVSVQDVRDLIGKIKAIERLPCVLNDELWEHMVFLDDL